MGIIHDSATGKTIELPLGEGAMEDAYEGGGYLGPEGDFEGTDLLAAMSDSMVPITNTEDNPWRMNAKVVLRYETALGQSYFAVCSGSMLDAEVVLTAGHCVYDYGGNGWAKEAWIYPGWDGVGGQWNPPPSIINPYGYGHSTAFAATHGWTDYGDFNYDVGLIAVDRAVGMLTGWFGWAYGGDCALHTSTTYNSASYPAEDCGEPGLHTGTDMYYWYGPFDSCPDWNRLELSTPIGGCFGAIWGGQSGGGAYYISDSNRFVHAVTSTSNRDTWARFTRLWDAWISYTNDTFISDYARGSDFDLQALDVNAEPATIGAGESTTLLNHLATNPTDGSADDTWGYSVYLSTNDNIAETDTLLSTQSYTFDFLPMSSARVNMASVTIPPDTPPGDYWLGVIYDCATDINCDNNDTVGWDPTPIEVTAAGAEDHELTVRAMYRKGRSLVDIIGADTTLDDGYPEGTPHTFEDVPAGVHELWIDPTPVQVGRFYYEFGYWEDLGKTGTNPTRSYDLQTDTELRGIFEKLKP